MIAPKRTRVVTTAAVSLLFGCGALFLGCGAGTPSREEQTAKLNAKLGYVQQMACLANAMHDTCEAGLSATFDWPARRAGSERKKGSIWCEGGRPHIRVSLPSGQEIEREFGQVVWEAMWRVLAASEWCASTHGRAVVASQNGQARTCDDPRFDMGSLFEMAAHMAKEGPPAEPKKKEVPESDGLEGICSITPSACPSSPSPCPVFDGDPWNGVTARPDASSRE